MFLHDVREDIPVRRVIGNGFNGLLARECLEPKFRCIAEKEFSVFRKRTVSMPYLPIMHIPSVWVIWVIKRATRRRTCRPVEGLWVILSQHFRDNPLIHEKVITDFWWFCDPAPLIHKHFHLIISAPQSQWRMMTETLNVIYKFLTDICLKFRCQFIHGACKHEVLPYCQPQFITDIIEPVIRIKSTTPYTDHIIVCQLTVHEKLSGAFLASVS